MIFILFLVKYITTFLIVFIVIKADLHFHSLYSDGELSVPELVQMAHQNEVQLLALTDHDVVVGYPLLNHLAKEHGISVLPGIECSVSWFSQELHVVGLGVDVHHPRMRAYLEVQKEKRISRARQIAHRLETIGFKDCFEKVSFLAGHENISRTHFAKLLVQEYRVRNTQCAFKDYLGQRGAAYVASQWVNLSETIALIRAVGGVAVLAHPLHYSLTTAQLKGLIQAFKEAGGEGIEVVSGFQTPKDTKRLAQFCLQFHLWASTGSDFHRIAPFRASLGQQNALPDTLQFIWQHDAFQGFIQLLE